jgi:hypothetical protein
MTVGMRAMGVIVAVSAFSLVGAVVSAGSGGNPKCDCDINEYRHCEDEFTGCKGCNSPHPTARYGTGNIRLVCITDIIAEGLCEQDGMVACYDTYGCVNGPWEPDMQCSPASGNCIPGIGMCAETEKDRLVNQNQELPTYWCTIGGS